MSVTSFEPNNIFLANISGCFVHSDHIEIMREGVCALERSLETGRPVDVRQSSLFYFGRPWLVTGIRAFNADVDKLIFNSSSELRSTPVRFVMPVANLSSPLRAAEMPPGCRRMRTSFLPAVFRQTHRSCMAEIKPGMLLKEGH